MILKKSTLPFQPCISNLVSDLILTFSVLIGDCIFTESDLHSLTCFLLSLNMVHTKISQNNQGLFKDFSKIYPTLFKDSSLLHLNHFVFFCRTRLTKNQRNQSDLQLSCISREAHAFEVLQTRSHASPGHSHAFFKEFFGKIKTNSNVFQ